MSKQWFVLSTFTGQESKVADSLKELRDETEVRGLVGKILVPMVSETFVRSGKEITRKRNLYPGYVFAEVNLFADYSKNIIDNEVFEKVSGIDGMIGFLGGKSPRPLSEDEISSLYRIMEEKKVTVEKTFSVGDSVKILDGAFSGNIGTIEKVSNETATVKISVFGEEMEQEIPVGSLEIASVENGNENESEV